MTEDATRLPELVRAIYAIVEELEALVPGRKFTPDGHMVGSLGEAWAAYLYGIVLLPCSAYLHDGRAPDGRLVQIKTRQGNSASTYPDPPEHLMVLRLLKDGSVEECFNGPAAVAWPTLGKRSEKNGQCRLSISALRRLQSSVPRDLRLPLVGR